MSNAQRFEGVSVSRDDWPIVVIDFSEQRVSDEAHCAMLDYVEALLKEARASRSKVFIVTDLTRMRDFASASRRKYVADWLKRTEDLSRVASVGAAHVTPSAVLRGLITAVFWISPSPSPSFCVATRSEAIKRGVELLKRANVPVPFRLT